VHGDHRGGPLRDLPAALTAVVATVVRGGHQATFAGSPELGASTAGASLVG
jgi:hypothetical protein